MTQVGRPKGTMGNAKNVSSAGISVDYSTRERLWNMRRPGERYNDILVRVMDFYDKYHGYIIE